MTLAYVDSSVVTAIALEESGVGELLGRLQRFQQVFSAPLLEAEVRSAAKREGVPVDEGWFGAVTWFNPARSVGPEIIRVLDVGYIRGADCWHLATALRLAEEPAQLTFLTLDLRQREIAAALGFAT
jgi:hypothetical protein